jgi:hypothetical protein
MSHKVGKPVTICVIVLSHSKNLNLLISIFFEQTTHKTCRNGSMKTGVSPSTKELYHVGISREKHAFSTYDPK